MPIGKPHSGGRKDDRAKVAEIVVESVLSVFVGYSPLGPLWSPFLQGNPQSWHAKIYNKKIPHAVQVVHHPTVVFFSTHTNFYSNQGSQVQIFRLANLLSDLRLSIRILSSHTYQSKANGPWWPFSRQTLRAATQEVLLRTNLAERSRSLAVNHSTLTRDHGCR